jgi:hypothetical protein
MAVLQGKLRGARLTVWLQVLFAYSPMGCGDLQIVSAPRQLQAFAVGGWEAGSSVGRALAVAVAVGVRWREMSPSITDWRCGLAGLLGALAARLDLAQTGQGLPPFGSTNCFICLAPTRRQAIPPIAADVLPILSIHSKRPTHLSPLTTHYSTNKRLAYLPCSAHIGGETATAWPEVHVHNPTQVTQPNDPTINSMATDLSPGL